MGKGSRGSGTERDMVKKEQAVAEGAPIKSHECPAGHTLFKEKIQIFPKMGWNGWQNVA